MPRQQPPGPSRTPRFSSFTPLAPRRPLPAAPLHVVEEMYEARPYSFNFGVDDAYSGVDYKRAESRSDKGVTRGSYSVALPDGRLQTVSYTADDNGFHATVTYEGEPTYGRKAPRRPAYRASNRVSPARQGKVFAPPPRQKAKPAPPLPTPFSPSPPPPPAPTFLPTTPARPVTKSHSLPLRFSTSPPPYAPPASPPPPTPSPFPYPTVPSPSPYYGSPTPRGFTFSPSPTPAPIFHTTPSYVLGLKASLANRYIPPTTWKPKYPRILEHTLRSAPSKRSYGRRLGEEEPEE